ncbi:MAG: DUF4334 domain-containing protein [Candidatus Hydrogenedentota bacterium]|nr:MAG: DUF4334 domain-containing protein [Candidatus Hydrogenedentota bacterium]
MADRWYFFVYYLLVNLYVKGVSMAQAEKIVNLKEVQARKRGKSEAQVINLPQFVYDITQYALFPINYLIGVACEFQPNQSKWDNVKSSAIQGSGKSLEEIQQDILDEKDIVFLEEDLVKLYDSLPTASAEEDLIGRTWRGRILRTGGSVLDFAQNFLVRPLSELGLSWGKRYKSQHIGDPLIVSWQDKIFVPIPAWGNVGMTDIRWRGEVTATMNYDFQPWKDYFRILHQSDEKTVLLGVWTHRDIAGGWFTLTLLDVE